MKWLTLLMVIVALFEGAFAKADSGWDAAGAKYQSLNTEYLSQMKSLSEPADRKISLIKFEISQLEEEERRCSSLDCVKEVRHQRDKKKSDIYRIEYELAKDKDIVRNEFTPRVFSLFAYEYMNALRRAFARNSGVLHLTWTDVPGCYGETYCQQASIEFKREVPMSGSISREWVTLTFVAGIALLDYGSSTSLEKVFFLPDSHFDDLAKSISDVRTTVSFPYGLTGNYMLNSKLDWRGDRPVIRFTNQYAPSYAVTYSKITYLP